MTPTVVTPDDVYDTWLPDSDWEVDTWRDRMWQLPPRPEPSDFASELQRELEWRDCARDPIWFLSRHWNILTPDRGIAPFRPFDYQCHSLDVMRRRRYVLILKARQIGYTALMAGFVCWWAMFKPASSIVYLSLRKEDAEKVVSAMRDYGLMELPKWMRDRVKVTNRASVSITLSNRSTIETSPTKNNPARGRALSLMVLDEWAFYSNAEAAWASAGPAVSVGGTAIALSSANGDGTPFSKQWRAARRRQTEWCPLFFGWWCRPERDLVWHQKQTAAMEPWAAAQEHPDSEEEAFREAGMAAFNHRWLDDAPIAEPERGSVTMEGSRAFFEEYVPGVQDDNRLRVWEHPRDDVHYRYVIGVDVASGHAKDYSAAHVLGEDGKMVAMWKGHIDADLFADLLCNLGMYYRSALIGVERNNHGVTTVRRMQRQGYGNLFVSRTLDRYNNPIQPQLGWYTDKKSKPLMIDGLAAALRDHILELPCQETSDELRAYRLLESRSPGSLQWGGWPNDDLVISLAIAVQMLQYVDGSSSGQGGSILAPEGSYEWFRSRRPAPKLVDPLPGGDQMMRYYAARRTNA